MWIYTLRRLGLSVVIISTAMAMLFLMIYLVPGDPASIALGPRATPEMREALRAKMGLDQPIPIQFANFFWNVIQGDLGIDVWSNRSVSVIVSEALPYTMILIFTGLGWAILLGIPMGCYSAIRRNSWVDKLIGVLSVSVIAVPSFIVALYALLIFAVALQVLPAIGAGEQGDVLSQASHLVLPSFAVGLGWVGYLARLVRASMLEIMGENYIRTARAFGLTEETIVYRYALKLAILPTVALLGVGVGSTLSSAVFAEIVFARPGIGKLVYDAVITRNYPVVMGSVLVTTLLIVLFALLADLLAAWLDPRVRATL